MFQKHRNEGLNYQLTRQISKSKAGSDFFVDTHLKWVPFRLVLLILGFARQNVIVTTTALANKSARNWGSHRKSI